MSSYLATVPKSEPSSVSKLRVVLLGPHPLGEDRISGGPEAVVVQLAQGLRAAGDVDVHVVFATGRVRSLTDFLHDGVTIHVLPLRRVPRWTTLRVNAWALGRAVRSLNPDVVHAHNGTTLAEAALISGAPAVITLHGVLQREAQVNRSYGMSWRESLSWAYEEWYERRCLRQARDVIAISPYVLDFYRGRTAARLHLIENPVAEPYFHLPDRTEPATVLCAARIIPRKNTLSLLQAFARVRGDIPHARLRLAGEIHSNSAYAQRCLQFVSDHGLEDSVEFLGWLDEAAMEAEYSRCTVVALFSYQETAPIALEQAMAAGKAIVASQVGGVGNMLADGRAGLLVAPDDVAGQAAALRQVLAETDLRRQLGQIARQEAQQRFRVDGVVTRTRALYQRVMDWQSGDQSRSPKAVP